MYLDDLLKQIADVRISWNIPKADQRQRHPIMLFVYWHLYDVEHVSVEILAITKPQ